MLARVYSLGKTIDRYLRAGYIFRFFYRHPIAYYYVARGLTYHYISKGQRRPRNLVLKLLEGCNAHCSFCYAQYENPISTSSELSLEELKDVIIQAKKIGCYTVTLSGGEPLIYPHLEEVVNFITRNRMIPFMATNGLAATPEVIGGLVKSGLCALNWSVHGPAEEHNRILDVPGAYEKLVRNAKEAVKLPLTNIVNHVLTPRSYRNGFLPEIIRTFMGMGFRAVSLLPVCMSGNQDELLDDEALKYLDNMAQKTYILMDTKNYTEPICPAAREDVLVNNYGEVQPCPFIPITFGNVRQDSLGEIFRRIETHPMFQEDSPVCMPARDHEFIKKYLIPIFQNRELPCPIEKIEKEIR